MSGVRRILVFDSGVGGLTVARQVRGVAPAATRVDYAADFAGFPYGDWPEERLREHLLALIRRLLGLARPDVVVIACNTASTLALDTLRMAFPDTPFVGTVPAIKPAARASRSGIIGVLATPGTVRREYTERLIHTFAWHRQVVLHGARGLAALAEEKLRSGAVDMIALREEIAPVFVRQQDASGARTDVVVLGCTHYPLLLPELDLAAPWPVQFIDPSEAIARQALRVAGLAGRQAGEHNERDAGEVAAGRAWITGIAAGWSDEDLRHMFAREGFDDLRMLDDGGMVA